MSAKQGLLKWLSGFLTFDIVVLGALLVPQMASGSAEATRITAALTTFIAPPAILLISAVIPQSVKHVLVFWRIRDVLPSHRAFSSLAQNDPRVDLQKLKDRVGELPHRPEEQQNLWFTIYQRHKTDAAVVDSHRMFLIFRDVAALSLALALAIPLLLWVYGLSFAIWTVFAVFGTQYLLAMLAARQSGRRFVCTVLSLESHPA